MIQRLDIGRPASLFGRRIQFGHDAPQEHDFGERNSK